MFNIGDRVKYVGNAAGLGITTLFLGKVGTVISNPRLNSTGHCYNVGVKWDDARGNCSPYAYNLQLINEEKKQMNEIDTTTTEGKIAVMQAFKEGKTIQFKGRYGSCWRDYTFGKEPNWSWGSYDYRIKKEPEVRWIKRYSDGTLGNTAFSDKMKADSSIVPDIWNFTWVKFVEAEDQE